MEDALKKSNSHIYRALLKNGYSNFSLTATVVGPPWNGGGPQPILEYCSPEQCIEREDFYLCSLPHEYNLLPKAGSRLGHKLSDETKTRMSYAKKGENNPFFGKNHSDETRKKMSDAILGRAKPV